MNTEKTQELIEQAHAELVAARRRLGEAVAAGQPADEIRAEADALAARIGDLRAALPVVQEADAAAAIAETANAEAARRVAQNKRRADHLSTCRKVDEALIALGDAYRELRETDGNVGGDPANTHRCRHNREHALRAAFAAACPSVLRDLRMMRVRASHVRSLADSESKLIREFEQ